MIIAQIAMLSLPALIAGLSAVVLFQIIDRIREHTAVKHLVKREQHEAAA